MKLRHIASNRPSVFPPIRFHDGLNVIFAKVKSPAALERDSHNLGKTFLIQVLDFALLGGLDKSHVFRKRPDLFDDFVFTITVEAPSGEYISVRRPVRGRAAIHMHRHKTQTAEEALKLPDAEWTETELSLESAEALLDRWLNLSVLRPYDYRKALNYVLRRQPDYDTVFRVSKFARGKDRDWKPLIALLLGFDHALVMKKYDLDEEIERLNKELGRLEVEADSRRTGYDELAGLIELQEQELARFRERVDSFSFRDIERRISKSLVDDIERGVSSINDRLYTLRYEIREIDHSLARGIDFDINEVAAVFADAGAALPDQVVKSYEDLVEFRRRISEGRNERLKDLRSRLVEEGEALAGRLDELDEKRTQYLRAIREQETMKKYRALQKDLAERERELERQRLRLALLDRATGVQRELLERDRERQEVVTSIEAGARRGNPVLKSIRARFASFVDAVINLPALMHIPVNAAGNLDFEVQTLDQRYRKQETEQGQGTSYKKIICAAFDLALLATHAQKPFYRFLYHDGVLEGLDNRRKRRWLDLVRSVAEEHGIQYVLTVIDTDLPRDENDKKLLFSRAEIVRELHDDGTAGRLFRMKAF